MTVDQLREYFTAPGEGLSRLEDVEEWNPAQLSEGFSGAADLDPAPRQRSLKALGQVKTESKKLLTQTGKAERQGASMGYDTEDLRTALSKAKTPRPVDNESALQKYVLGPLDAPGHVIRALTMPGGSNFDWDATKDPKNWNKRIDRAARQGHTGAIAGKTIKDVIGATAGSVVGAGLAVPGIATDLYRGRSLGSVARAAGRTFEKGQKDTGDFGLTTLADPLNVLPVSKLGKVGGRLLAKGAESVPVLKKAAQGFIGAGDVPLLQGLAKREKFSDIARQVRGRRDLFIDRYVARELRTDGVKSVEDAEKVIRRAEMLGASQSAKVAKRAFMKASGVTRLDDLPPRAVEMLDRATNPNFQTLSKWLSSPTMNQPKLAAVARLYEKGVAAIKTNVLARSPAHHAINVFNDSLQMFMGGMNNPARITQAIDILHGKGTIQLGGAVLNAKSFRRLMQREGLLGGALERMGYIGDEGKAIAAKNLAKEAGVKVPNTGKSLVKEVLSGGIADRAPGVLPVNAKFGENWSDISKAAMFIDRLKKGDSVKDAARHTLSYLLDYRDANKLTQMTRWVVPFINWYMKAPGMVAKAIVNRPGRVIAPERFAQAIAGEEQIAQPEFRSKAGTNIPLSARGQDIMNTFRSAPAEGQDYLRTRLPATEALSAPMELLQNNMFPIAEQAGPLPQALLASLGKDPITGSEIPDGAMEGLKYGLFSAVPSALVSRPMKAAYNIGLSELLGPDAPARPLSPFRGSSYDKELDRNREILSALGLATFTAKPEDRPREELSKLRKAVQSGAPKVKRAHNVAQEKKQKRD